jgi:glyoxylase-like metal-dependent hydrolase (beta-lactamase superfamily II)
MIRKISATLFLGVLFFGASFVWAQQDLSKVEIKTIKLTPQIYMLTGAGGNLGISVGKNGIFLIDDQFAPLTDRILKAISTISDQPIKFLVNTHWHFDHTGGNENMGKGDTIIVAHENVRKRMAAGQVMEALNFTVPPAVPHALPVLTFPTGLTFHWNGETIEVVHFPGAHTDGDSAIFFKTANVIHAGDLFFNGIYPFIDVQSGGSLKGMIQSVDVLLQHADPSTRIIPGHGPLADKSDLQAYRDMLGQVYHRILELKKTGLSIDEVVESKPTREFDNKWGNGFLKPDKWVRIVYSAVD